MGIAQVRQNLAGFVQTSYYSYFKENWKTSDTPINTEYDQDKAKRQCAFASLKIRFPNSEIREVGIVEKLHDQVIRKGIAHNLNDGEIEAAILQAENELIDERSKSNLSASSLARLNHQFRFFRVKTILDSYAALHVSIVGTNALKLEPDRRSVTSTIANGILYLERFDAKHTSVLSTPYATSSVCLQRYASILPKEFNPSVNEPATSISRMVMMLNALIQSDNQFSGRIGIKHEIGNEIDWLWPNRNILSTPKFMALLPDGFRLDKKSTVGNLRLHKRQASLILQGGFQDEKSKLPLFSNFYHLTHRNNLASIFERGILSWSTVRALGVPVNDISDPNVQSWRDNIEPCYKHRIHDYVPLYINPRNPMLYVRREIKRELVILIISNDVLNQFDHVFTDGNAASRNTLFSYEPTVLENSMNILVAPSWVVPGGKRRRCAELLVFPVVPSHLICGVICCDDSVAFEARMVSKAPVSVIKDVFF